MSIDAVRLQEATGILQQRIVKGALSEIISQVRGGEVLDENKIYPVAVFFNGSDGNDLNKQLGFFSSEFSTLSDVEKKKIIDAILMTMDENKKDSQLTQKERWRDLSDNFKKLELAYLFLEKCLSNDDLKKLSVNFSQQFLFLIEQISQKSDFNGRVASFFKEVLEWKDDKGDLLEQSIETIQGKLIKIFNHLFGYAVKEDGIIQVLESKIDQQKDWEKKMKIYYDVLNEKVNEGIPLENFFRETKRPFESGLILGYHAFIAFFVNNQTISDFNDLGRVSRFFKWLHEMSFVDLGGVEFEEDNEGDLMDKEEIKKVFEKLLQELEGVSLESNQKQELQEWSDIEFKITERLLELFKKRNSNLKPEQHPREALYFLLAYILVVEKKVFGSPVKIKASEIVKKARKVIDDFLEKVELEYRDENLVDYLRWIFISGKIFIISFSFNKERSELNGSLVTNELLDEFKKACNVVK